MIGLCPSHLIISTCWCHLVPSSSRRHNQSRAPVLCCTSVSVTAQHSESHPGKCMRYSFSQLGEIGKKSDDWSTKFRARVMVG